MDVKFTSRIPNDKRGVACLPLVANVPKQKSGDWQRVACPVCGADCWMTPLAKQVIAIGISAACTMCVLRVAGR